MKHNRHIGPRGMSVEEEGLGYGTDVVRVIRDAS